MKLKRHSVCKAMRMRFFSFILNARPFKTLCFELFFKNIQKQKAESFIHVLSSANLLLFVHHFNCSSHFQFRSESDIYNSFSLTLSLCVVCMCVCIKEISRFSSHFSFLFLFSCALSSFECGTSL